jgi:hypothetical protein
LGETGDFLEQIVTKGAADASVRHLNELFLGSTELGAPTLDQSSVDVDLAHVVDNHRHALAIPVVEYLI